MVELAESLPMALKFDADAALAAHAPRSPATPVSTVSTPAATGKLVLRRAFAKRLPAEILERPKASFPLPFRDWIVAEGSPSNATAALSANQRFDALTILECMRLDVLLLQPVCVMKDQRRFIGHLAEHGGSLENAQKFSYGIGIESSFAVGALRASRGHGRQDAFAAGFRVSATEGEVPKQDLVDPDLQKRRGTDPGRSSACADERGVAHRAACR